MYCRLDVKSVIFRPFHHAVQGSTAAYQDTSPGMVVLGCDGRRKTSLLTALKPAQT